VSLYDILDLLDTDEARKEEKKDIFSKIILLNHFRKRELL